MYGVIRKSCRKGNVSSTLQRKKKKLVTAKKETTNRTKSELISHCRIAGKTNLISARFARARCMIDRFRNWGDHGKPESGKIKGHCPPPHAEFSGRILALRARHLSKLGPRKGWGWVVCPGGEGSIFQVISLWERRVILLSR